MLLSIVFAGTVLNSLVGFLQYLSRKIRAPRSIREMTASGTPTPAPTAAFTLLSSAFPLMIVAEVRIPVRTVMVVTALVETLELGDVVGATVVVTRVLVIGRVTP